MPHHPGLNQELKNWSPGKPTPLFKSEWVRRDLDPEWNPFEIEVKEVGGMENNIVVQVFDHERSGRHIFIGQFECTFREFTLANSSFRICHPKKSYGPLYPHSGVFYVNHWEPVDPVRILQPIGFEVQFRAEKIERRGLGLKSNPFLTFKAKTYLSDEFVRVEKTEVRLNSRSCEWPVFIMDIGKYGGWDSIIEIECWDQDKKGRADFIGKCKTTLRELSYYKSNPMFSLVNPKKKGRIGYRHSGKLYLMTFKPIAAPEDYEPELVEYDKIEITIHDGAHGQIPPEPQVQQVNMISNSQGIPLNQPIQTRPMSQSVSIPHQMQGQEMLIQGGQGLPPMQPIQTRPMSQSVSMPHQMQGQGIMTNMAFQGGMNQGMQPGMQGQGGMPMQGQGMNNMPMQPGMGMQPGMQGQGGMNQGMPPGMPMQGGYYN